MNSPWLNGDKATTDLSDLKEIRMSLLLREITEAIDRFRGEATLNGELRAELAFTLAMILGGILAPEEFSEIEKYIFKKIKDDHTYFRDKYLKTHK